MSINSRQKGAAGEREFAKFLRDHGHEARRGVQHAGGPDSPDVVCNIPDVHFEVKRKEAGNPYDWLAQAERDAPETKMPIVAHRRNGKEWMAILSMEDLMTLLSDYNELEEVLASLHKTEDELNELQANLDDFNNE